MKLKQVKNAEYSSNSRCFFFFVSFMILGLGFSVSENYTLFTIFLILCMISIYFMVGEVFLKKKCPCCKHESREYLMQYSIAESRKCDNCGLIFSYHGEFLTVHHNPSEDLLLFEEKEVL